MRSQIVAVVPSGKDQSPDVRTQEGCPNGLQEVRTTLSLRPSALRSLAVFVLAALCVVGTSTTAFAFHEYSTAGESSGVGFTGVKVTRFDVSISGIPNDGCQSPYTGSPVYQTQWVLMTADATKWVEIGTGHQCGDNYRYTFAGYGNAAGWHPINEITAGGSANAHTFKVWRDGGSYIFSKDNDTIAGVTLSNNDEGPFVDMGLESYAANAHVDCNNNFELSFKKGNNSWNNWDGRDRRNVSHSAMHGVWASDTTFRTSQNEYCA